MEKVPSVRFGDRAYPLDLAKRQRNEYTWTIKYGKCQDTRSERNPGPEPFLPSSIIGPDTQNEQVGVSHKSRDGCPRRPKRSAKHDYRGVRASTTSRGHFKQSFALDNITLIDGIDYYKADKYLQSDLASYLLASGDDRWIIK